eukprot:scaffold9814_cov54-Phaeocystis_antarctica.AAC.1
MTPASAGVGVAVTAAVGVAGSGSLKRQEIGTGGAAGLASPRGAEAERAVEDCEVLCVPARRRSSWRRRRRRRCGGRLGSDRPPAGIASCGGAHPAAGSARLAAIQGGCRLPDVVAVAVAFSRVGEALLRGPPVDKEPALPPRVRGLAKCVRGPAQRLPSGLGAFHHAIAVWASATARKQGASGRLT